MRLMVFAASLVLIVGISPPVAAAQADGQALYREQCRTCHGLDGHATRRAVSQYKNIPTLDSAFFAKVSDDSLLAVLRHGAGRDMKSFKDKLTADEMTAVVHYLRLLSAAKPGAP